ncbi:hypothetical protein WNE31_18330, partial [Shimia sp. SDUM112013]
MVTFSFDSDISYFFEFMNGSGADSTDYDAFFLDHQDALEYMDNVSPDMQLVSLSSNEIIFSDAVTGHTMTLTGTGISPVSSLDDLTTAIDNGLASGAFSTVTLEGPAYAGGPVITLATLQTQSDSYTLSSGNQTLTLQGVLPTTLSQFSDLLDAQTRIDNIDFLTDPQIAQLISDLSAFAGTGLELANDGEVLISLQITDTALTLMIDDYTLTVNGTFPDDLGAMLDVMLDMDAESDLNGYMASLANVPGLAINSMTVTGPEGQTLMSMTGPITDEASIDNATVMIDGVVVNDLILGNDYESFDGVSPDFADQLFVFHGDGAHVFGLGGNDYLQGGSGNDYLFGGSGNDTLNAGDGNDYLNPGRTAEEGWDIINPGSGNDTVDFSDVYRSGAALNQFGLSNGFVADINSAANTGTVDKGALGTTTLIDVGNVVEWWGLEVYGTAHNDTLNFTLRENSTDWVSYYNFGGSNTINVLGGDGIVRLDYRGQSGGINANLTT